LDGFHTKIPPAILFIGKFEKTYQYLQLAEKKIE
jgi:hypothetical protein